MNTNTSLKREINYAWWLLRTVFGVTFIFAGIDKFFGFVTNWSQFINPNIIEATGLSAELIVKISGVIEAAIGILLFTKWVEVATIFVVVWMISNGLYLAFFRMYLDTAARYCTLGLCALAFFYLTRARQKL